MGLGLLGGERPGKELRLPGRRGGAAGERRRRPRGAALIRCKRGLVLRDVARSMMFGNVRRGAHWALATGAFAVLLVLACSGSEPETVAEPTAGAIATSARARAIARDTHRRLG